MKRRMFWSGILGVLAASPVLADDPVSVTASAGTISLGSGAPQVQMFGSTNVSGRMVVQVIGPNGEKHVQVFDSSNPLAGATNSSVITASATLADPDAKVTWLGVSTEPAGDEVRAQLSLDAGIGLTVHNVVAESPAEKAGLQTFDVLVQFDDQKLMSSEQLHNLVIAKKPGETARLTYLRKGKEATATATLIEHADTGANLHAIDLGGFNLDVSKIMGQFPQLSQSLSSLATGFPSNFLFATNFSAGAGRVLASPQGIYSFGMTDSNMLQHVTELLKGMNLTGTNMSNLLNEALKGLQNPQPNPGP
jgi:hypothetical protein